MFKWSVIILCSIFLLKGVENDNIVMISVMALLLVGGLLFFNRIEEDDK